MSPHFFLKTLFLTAWCWDAIETLLSQAKINFKGIILTFYHKLSNKIIVVVLKSTCLLDEFYVRCNQCGLEAWTWLVLLKKVKYFLFVLGMTNAEVLHQVDHGYRMQCPQGCPRALYDIMLECWHKDPVKRPTFETLQWKLEDFFTMSDSEYRDATAYWLNYSLLSLLQACLFVWHLWLQTCGP